MAATECTPSACLPCLPACLLVCLPASLLACLPSCLLALLSALCALSQALSLKLYSYLEPPRTLSNAPSTHYLRKVMTHGQTEAHTHKIPSSRAPVGAKNEQYSGKS